MEEEAEEEVEDDHAETYEDPDPAEVFPRAVGRGISPVEDGWVDAHGGGAVEVEVANDGNEVGGSHYDYCVLLS